jgi:hypothetical protein
METTFEPTLQENIRTKIALIEFIELSALGFALWLLGAFNAITVSGEHLFDQISFLLGIETILLGSWAIYNVYIRIARAGGRTIDVAVWILASLLTASYTFWAWSFLDINGFLMSKLFYRGEAPVEYAWSTRSKQVRKLWELMQKTQSN